jgi:hypothetical protein
MVVRYPLEREGYLKGPNSSKEEEEERKRKKEKKKNLERN